MTETIHVALLHEGVAVWRPVPAIRIAGDDFVILRPNDYDAEDEHRQFEPGTVVRCELRSTDHGPALMAVSPATMIA